MKTLKLFLAAIALGSLCIAAEPGNKHKGTKERNACCKSADKSDACCHDKGKGEECKASGFK